MSVCTYMSTYTHILGNGMQSTCLCQTVNSLDVELEVLVEHVGDELPVEVSRGHLVLELRDKLRPWSCKVPAQEPEALFIKDTLLLQFVHLQEWRSVHILSLLASS